VGRVPGCARQAQGVCNAAQPLCFGWQPEAIGPGESQHRWQQFVTKVQIGKAAHVGHLGLSVYGFASKLVLMLSRSIHACHVSFFVEAVVGAAKMFTPVKGLLCCLGFCQCTLFCGS
jgi:hypothetical protein